MGRDLEEITRGVDLLVEASEAAEDRLEHAGVARAHDWMFGLREILYDLRRFQGTLAEVLDRAAGAEARADMRDIVILLKYEMIPHIEGHLGDLEAALEEPGRDSPGPPP